jgi:hypothetical protein
MDRFRTWAEKEYSPRKRFIAIVIAGAFFLFLLPGLIFLLANGIDSIFKLPSFNQGTLNSFIGAILILSGGAFAIWTIVAQYRFARGTPLPMMATHLPEEAEAVELQVRSRFGTSLVHYAEVSPVVGIHVGPVAVGMEICAERYFL